MMEVRLSVRIKQVHPKKLSLRKSNDGRVLYSQVVEVTGSGRLIFVAGQVARDSSGNNVGVGDMRAQIEQVGNNIKDALEAVGATLGDIVRTTTYVTDIDEYFKHADMRLRYFGSAIPTSTTVEVRRLASPEHLVEIEAFAVAE
jgi:2-iminobutanoate/2-iminopropanoate deaminase